VKPSKTACKSPLKRRQKSHLEVSTTIRKAIKGDAKIYKNSDLKIMTWNASSLCARKGSRELDLRNLVEKNEADVIIVTEAELAPSQRAFALPGYTTYLPLMPCIGDNDEQSSCESDSEGDSGTDDDDDDFLSEGKNDDKNINGIRNRVRLIALVKKSLTSTPRLDIMVDSLQSIWLEVELPHGGNIVIGGLYRLWSSPTPGQDLDVIMGQIEMASKAKRLIVLGDLNLDQHRQSDPTYSSTLRKYLRDLMQSLAGLGIEYHPTPKTFKSNGRYKLSGQKSHRTSCIDHVYSAGIRAEVTVLPDSPTDHWPVLACVKGAGTPARRSTITRRNFKNLSRTSLEAALNKHDWNKPPGR
jgi:hypothetical protein